MYYKRKELGRKLQAARLAKGLTVRQAAEGIGISYPYLSRIESGINALGKHSGAIARFYKLDQAELEEMAAAQVPGFGTYLRAAYELSDEAIVELEGHFAEVAGRKRGRS